MLSLFSGLMDISLFLVTSCLLSLAIACSGILSGLFGIGGGIFYVPLVNWILSVFYPDIDQPMIIANNTSLASIVGLNLMTLWLRRTHIELTNTEILQRLAVISLGAVTGAWCVRYIPNNWMHNLFSIFLTLLALGYFLYSFRLQNTTQHTTDALSSPWAFLHRYLLCFLPVISCMASILGIGGAIFLFPLLLRLGYSKQQAAANATLGSFMIASMACVAAWLHPFHVNTSLYFFGDILWPFIIPVILVSSFFIRLGIQLNHQQPQYRLYRLLSGILLLVGTLHHQQL